MSQQPEPATAGNTNLETDVGSVFVSNYPPYSFWGEEQLTAAVELLDSPPATASPLGLYLHIPFCRKRCKFCYFRVYTDKNFDEIETYLNALASEVEAYAAKPMIGGRPLEFVYFGGGTPSYISAKHLRKLAARLQAAIPWDGVREAAFECEPGTLTKSKLEAIREIGITRLSLGIENFDDEILQENGRAHLSREIGRCMPWIDELDFPQLNIDLIAGMVGETWDTWRETVRKTVDLGADSVTIYQLELPFNTRYSKQFLDGSLDRPLADWDDKRAWQNYAFEELEKVGYEVSSAYTMVKSNEECPFIYRNSVWQGCDLLGTGVASFSHLQGYHLQNVDGWGEYLAQANEGVLPLGRAYETNADERLTRELILQLKTGGITTDYFSNKFDVDVLARFGPAWQKLEQEGMLELGANEVHLTRQGLLRVDALLPEFYEEKHRNARYT